MNWLSLDRYVLSELLISRADPWVSSGITFVITPSTSSLWCLTACHSPLRSSFFFLGLTHFEIKVELICLFPRSSRKPDVFNLLQLYLHVSQQIFSKSSLSTLLKSFSRNACASVRQEPGDWGTRYMFFCFVLLYTTTYTFMNLQTRWRGISLPPPPSSSPPFMFATVWYVNIFPNRASLTILRSRHWYYH